ncbi:MAG: hypothetical protein IPN85_03055 [Flavobacteriales bacterium]|nr:hypothetical protein [Flavobacteriales bacterium]MBL0034184.1 hypothetical protein [Flavobacteriales bacterium]
MKTLFIAVLLIAMHSASAQPGNLEAWLTNPCGMPPNDSLDVTGAGVPDLLIGGYSMGTDDVPSSTGSCTRFVGTLHGTTLLCGLDRTGQRVPQAFAVGDTVPALNEGIQNDLQIPRFVFAERSIIVMQWGYGHQVGGPVPAPGLEKQVFVFLTRSPYEDRLGSFTLEPLMDLRSVRITVGTLVHANEPLIVR